MKKQKKNKVKTLNDEANSEVVVDLPVIATNQKIKNAIKEILWMARRYADGRQTFAATSFNDAYDLLRDEFGEDIEYNKINEWKDHTLTEGGRYFPYAQDGGGQMFDCVSGRKYYKNAEG